MRQRFRLVLSLSFYALLLHGSAMHAFDRDRSNLQALARARALENQGTYDQAAKYYQAFLREFLVRFAGSAIWIANRRWAPIRLYQNGTRAQQQTHKQQDSNSTFCHCGISSCRKLDWRLPNTRQFSVCA